jgi:hypothetical protein
MPDSPPDFCPQDGAPLLALAKQMATEVGTLRRKGPALYCQDCDGIYLRIELGGLLVPAALDQEGLNPS